jgi:hypothetical protein
LWVLDQPPALRLLTTRQLRRLRRTRRCAQPCGIEPCQLLCRAPAALLRINEALQLSWFAPSVQIRSIQAKMVTEMGKKQDDVWELRVKPPFSLYQAFGMAVASIYKT